MEKMTSSTAEKMEFVRSSIEKATDYYSTKALIEKEWINEGKPCYHRVNDYCTRRIGKDEALKQLAEKPMGGYPFRSIQFTYNYEINEVILLFFDFVISDFD